MSALNTLLCGVVPFFFYCSVQGQKDLSSYKGIYGDWMPNGEALITSLELKDNGRFILRTVDPIYPQTHTSYTNQGQWISKGKKEIVLNPHLKKREPQLTLKQRHIGLQDSIEIKINHYVALYKNQQFVANKETPFDVLTLFFNKKRNYVHLTRTNADERSCAWAPKIRNNIAIDSSNRFRIPKKDLHTLGVFTYGFRRYEPLKVTDKKADYFEIDIVLSMDVERMPRNKSVIIKGNRAYFYERHGKVALSALPLRKKRN
ncbi:hypothetical protein [Spongiimicrobium salis]|uniref:hypothetical protein n=1 Tax=Spongiimicrobium salis TaxID=1667022 RepID=UPI00374DA64D